MTQRLSGASLAAAVLAACVHAPGAPGSEDAAAEIMRLDATGGEAAARRDAAGTLAGFGDDVVYCGSRAVVLGKEGLAAAWKPWFLAHGPLVSWTPERAGAASSADVGWTAGRSRVEIKGPEGRSRVTAGEYLTVWSRGPGGWRAMLDLAGSQPADELGPGERREVRALRSAAGDVEAAMGLWQRTAGEGSRAGAYLTVRRREAGGAWQVVEDRISPFAGAAPVGEITLLDAAWAWAMARGDGDGFRALVGEDAVFAGRALLRGRDQVWSAWKAFFAEGGPRIRWRPTASGVAGSGDLAWTTGRYRLERRDPEGKPVASHGWYLTVWDRDAGGAWRVALDGGLGPLEAPRLLERDTIRSLASKDGALEASMGTWRRKDQSGRSGAWITLREKIGGEWKVRADGGMEIQPSR